MHALIADIGGTNARFELVEGERVTKSVTFASSAHPSVEGALDAFVGEVERRDLSALVLAVAGPVENGRCQTTNLPWVLDEQSLSERFGRPTKLLNDFEAVALGVDTLGPRDLASLQPGLMEATGTVAILGAGTGLGQALLVRESTGGTQVLATEGGHTDFGPWDERSDVVLRRLREKYGGHVSPERVASGMGLADLFDIVRAEGWAEALPSTLAAVGEDPGRAIGDAPHDPAAALALQIFSRALGAEAGNLALKSLPRGGIRIAGGIAPKLLRSAPDLFRSHFLLGLLDKGRMRPILERLAVDVVLASDVGLRGARRAALKLGRSEASVRT